MIRGQERARPQWTHGMGQEEGLLRLYHTAGFVEGLQLGVAAHGNVEVDKLVLEVIASSPEGIDVLHWARSHNHCEHLGLEG